ELFKTELRFINLQWNDRGDIAIWREFDRSARKNRTYLQDLASKATPKLVFDLQSEDRYKNPGEFLTTTNKSDNRVLQQSSDGAWFYLSVLGATQQGDRPFLRKFNVKTFKTEEVFRSQDPYYESLVSLLDADAKHFLTSRESVTDPPNYFLHDSS